MKKLITWSFIVVFFLLAPCVFAKHSPQSASSSSSDSGDQLPSDSGVLVSPPIGQDSSQDSSTQDNSNGSGHHKKHKAQDDSGDASSSSDNTSQSPTTSSTDEIVVKSADLVISQMTANMKLTDDQLSAIRPVITDNIVKVRDLQLSVQQGKIDSKTMVNQKQQLTDDENKWLSRILTADQMKAWMNILQDQQ